MLCRPRSQPRRSPGDPWTETSSSGLARATRRHSQIWCIRSATRCSAIARRILRDPGLAEDVLQNALVTIWRKLPHLREPIASRPGPSGSSSTPATRTRRATGNGRPPFASSRSTGRTTSDDFRSIADRDELEQAFRRLPLDQRAVFVLHHHVGLPLVAVAETLGIPDGTARSRLHYATRALRAAFEAGRAQTNVQEGRLA